MIEILWCTIAIVIDISGTGDLSHVDTASKGVVVSRSGDDITLDFSGYASQHGYVGDYSYVTVKDYECTK